MLLIFKHGDKTLLNVATIRLLGCHQTSSINIFVKAGHNNTFQKR